MLVCTPDYDSRFRCLAAACPHSCCIGWEVVIDPVTAAGYRAEPGPLGEELRRAMTVDGEEICFALAGRRCPFLDGENLCRIHRELGEARTSATCRSHPRFTEDYGALRERSLAASCPAVTALVLGTEEPLTFSAADDGGLAGDWTDPWLLPLLACRARALELLRERIVPLPVRLGWLLLLANDAQALLDEDRAEELPALADAYAEPPAALPELPEPGDSGLFPKGLELLAGLETLEPDWPALLKVCLDEPGEPACPDASAERIACYFVFRYFLRAVNDGDLLSRAEFAVFSTLTVRRLSARAGASGLPDPQEALRRYCREIEHSQENRRALQAAFCRDPALGLEHFFAELRKLSGERAAG